MSTSTGSGGTIYFWREYEEPYGYLSQWYANDFVAPSANAKEDDKTFVTAEQYMMYRKAMTFNDTEIAEKIMSTTDPKKQKGLGRKVKNFDGATWDHVKEQAVEDGNYYKFSRSKDKPDMRKLLLDTEEKLLVEASPYDRIWGVGYGATKAKENRANWGQNLLGHALMRARARLQAEDQASNDGKGT